MTRYKKIAITTGDRDGIGFEVTAKSLEKFSKKRSVVFFIFRHSSQQITQPHLFKLIDKHWSRVTVGSLEDALDYLDVLKKPQKNLLLDISSERSEAEWVLDVAKACAAKKLHALVTGPLSKVVSAKLPKNPLGHTGIFRQLYPQKKLFMSFVGKDFNVMLATDHMPLSLIEKRLKQKDLQQVYKAAQSFKKLLNSKKNYAVLGLNPHAGEGGLIGSFEKNLLRGIPADADGPLVPDAAFLKKNWKKYAFFVCLYHDQGLIPFKMHHGQDSGVHVTLGLPFIRTSVDHGTAFDLFNKNIANYNSMLEAINLSYKLAGV